MKYVVIVTRDPEAPAEAFTPELLNTESDRSLTLLRDGVFREIYSRDDGKGAVLVLEAATEAEARAALDSLPMAQAGLISFAVYGTRAYRGFLRGLPTAG